MFLKPAGRSVQCRADPSALDEPNDHASEAVGEKEGEISVSLAHIHSGSDRDRIRLEIADTGCGMTEEVQCKMFDPFFTTNSQGAASGSRRCKGSFASRSCCLARVNWRQASRPTQLSTADGATLTGTVLLVEDEDNLRQAVSRMLGKKDLTVIEARDGTSALDCFRINASRIDVVLLDMTLPGMSDREVFRELRRIRPDLKVIVTSAYGMDQALSAMGELQPWFYIRKPYQFAALMELLRKICSQRQGMVATG
jgi:CheY-like chemotaxis protein